MLFLLVPSGLAGTKPAVPQKRKPDSLVKTESRYLKQLYFYPFDTEGSFLHEFDPDQIVKDATVNFPTIKEMSGISVIVYWSQLCPSEHQCNFGIIDRILDFWGKAGKKVVLCVATIGAPIESASGGTVKFVPATPGWVLAKTDTFLAKSNNFIGLYRNWRNMANNADYQFVFPRYDDTGFVNEVRSLVQTLGRRYDGNPVISYVRIGTGKSGEDNPYGRIGTAWFTNQLWVGFSRTVTDFYLTSFRKSRLEFDLLWTGIVAAGAKTATPMREGDQQRAQEFIDYLLAKNIFIAFNGIAPPPARNVHPGATAANPAGECNGYDAHADETTPATDAALYAQIARLKERRIPFGLEGNALTDPCMKIDRISSILERYKPQRFIFFGDAAAVINFEREGLNDKNRYEIDALTRVLVPQASKGGFEAQQLQAMPRIKEFAGDVEQFVQEHVQAQ